MSESELQKSPTDEDLFSRDAALADRLADLGLVLVVPRGVDVPAWACAHVRKFTRGRTVRVLLTCNHIAEQRDTQGRTRRSRRRPAQEWASRNLLRSLVSHRIQPRHNLRDISSGTGQHAPLGRRTVVRSDKVFADDIVNVNLRIRRKWWGREELGSRFSLVPRIYTYTRAPVGAGVIDEPWPAAIVTFLGLPTRRGRLHFAISVDIVQRHRSSRYLNIVYNGNGL